LLFCVPCRSCRPWDLPLAATLVTAAQGNSSWLLAFPSPRPLRVSVCIQGCSPQYFRSFSVFAFPCALTGGAKGDAAPRAPLILDSPEARVFSQPLLCLSVTPTPSGFSALWKGASGEGKPFHHILKAFHGPGPQC